MVLLHWRRGKPADLCVGVCFKTHSRIYNSYTYKVTNTVKLLNGTVRVFYQYADQHGNVTQTTKHDSLMPKDLSLWVGVYKDRLTKDEKEYVSFIKALDPNVFDYTIDTLISIYRASKGDRNYRPNIALLGRPGYGVRYG